MNSSTQTAGNGLPSELDRKFTQVRARIRLLSVLKGLALVVLTALAAFGVAIFLDRVFHLRTPFRLLVLAATLAALAVCLAANLVVPLLRRYSARRIALSVEDRHPQLGDTVVSTVELAEARATGRLTTSGELVDALTSETLARTRRIDFRCVAPLSAIRWALVLALVLAGLVGTYCAVRPLVAANVLARIVDPTADIPAFTYTKLAVEPGSLHVPKGSEIQVSAVASGRIPPRARVAWREPRSGWRRRSLVGDDADAFRFTFKNVLRPIEYRFRAGDARSGTYKITPVEPPAIVAVAITYRYPDYTGLGEQPGPSGGGNIRVLRGTRVSVVVTANKPIARASAVFNDGTNYALDVREATVGPLTFVATDKGTYAIRLADRHGFTNAEAVPYAIVPLPDREPEIDILSPRGSVERTADMDVPIRFAARDDFGLTSMRLVYHATDQTPKEAKDRLPEDVISGAIPLELPRPDLNEFAAEYLLDLSSLELRPGMIVRYHIEATDNDAQDGPKTGRSVERTITIISDEDSFKEIEHEQLALQRRLRKIIERQLANKKLTEQLEAELADKNTLSPEEADRLDDAKRAQDTIAQSTRELAQGFDKTTQKMQENALVEMRSVMRMQEMKSALEQIAHREMPRASSQLKAAREASQAHARARELDRARTTEEKIIEALSRIDEQFDKLQDEQRLLSLAAAAKTLARQQDRNIESTKEARNDLLGRPAEQLGDKQKRRLKKLVERQRKLREKLEEFQEQMERTRKQLEYKRSEDAAAVENAAEALKQSHLADTMKQAEADLRANHLNKSLKPQKEVSDKLWEMAKRLEQAQTAKLAGEFENTEQAMREQIAEIDRLIELEREIIAATGELPSGRDDEPMTDERIDRFGEIEQSQGRLRDRAGEFRDLLAEIFEQLVVIGTDPVTPLRAAVNSMGDAAERLGELRRDDALADEVRALEGLIEARTQLAQALAQMMAESKLSMMMQGIDLLGQIIERQRKINDDTKDTDAQRPRDDELAAAFRRLIQRLANRQGRLGDEVAGLGEQIQRLRRIADMMRDASGMLKQLRTGKDTQDLQERILTALEQLLFQLQAEMQAQMQAMGITAVAGRTGTGNRDPRNLPSRLKELPGGATTAELRLPERLRRELLQAWNERYPESFRALLNLYYSRLSNEENPY